MSIEVNNWGIVMPSVADGTRPTTSNWGTSITPGNNTYGSYTEIMSDTAVTDEAFLIDIIFSNANTTTAARDMICTVGFDFGGGTTYTNMEINHLLCTGASAYISGRGPVVYRFPIRIPAGTAIAVKASVNNATVGSLYAACILYGKPSALHMHKYGTFVRTYGADTANSRGTLVTAGTTSEGSFTDLGTLSDDIWGWEFGYGANASSIGSQVRFVDIGIGSTQKIAIPNAVVVSDTDESFSKQQAFWHCNAKSGEHVYGRIQHSGAADNQASLMAYGVGG